MHALPAEGGVDGDALGDADALDVGGDAVGETGLPGFEWHPLSRMTTATIANVVQRRLMTPIMARQQVQWKKCRSPVKYMVTPASWAAAITSSSRIEPPG